MRGRVGVGRPLRRRVNNAFHPCKRHTTGRPNRSEFLRHRPRKPKVRLAHHWNCSFLRLGSFGSLLRYSTPRRGNPKRERPGRAPVNHPRETVQTTRIVDANSGSHLPATFGAAAASIRAIFHLTDPLTIRCTMCADLGAEATGAVVKFRADQHDVRGCSTDLGASHDQAEVLGFGMLTADLQTMSHRRRQARLIAAQTFFDAAFHFSVDARQVRAPSELGKHRRGIAVQLAAQEAQILPSKTSINTIINTRPRPPPP